MTVAADLQSGLHDHYRSLLPDGLSPTPGGIADGIAALIAQLLTLEVQAASALILDWLPQTASEAALTTIGEGRSLRRWPGEPLDTWRRRVQGAAEYWALAGTVPGLKLALAQAGYQAMVIEHLKDPDPARWAEFSVTLTPLAPIVTPWQWGTGRWGQQPGQPRRRWGGLDPNGIPLEYLKDLIREVKPAHTRLRRLTYRNRARYWGGTARWGEGRAQNGRPGVPAGWGVSYGLPFVVSPTTTSADNGPTWGGESELVLYDIDAS